MKVIESIDTARSLLDAGEVIAYPTEAVYGLGCDALNVNAVLHILHLKKRAQEKGLIVLIADWEQLWPLVDMEQISEERLEAVKKTWPGFVTWVFPKSRHLSDELTGAHRGVAIRMTAHPVARALCAKSPIVSTSANIAGTHPARDMKALSDFFPEGVAGVMAGDLGKHFAVSKIYNILDGSNLRN